MLTLSGLFVYPVKSLGGIALQQAVVQPRGLQYDRRWMLVDEASRFVSQREVGELALLGTAIEPPFLVVFSKKKPANRIRIPLEPPEAGMPELDVQIWDDHCRARLHATAVNDWFSAVLGTPLRLVFLPDSTRRPVDARYAPGHAVSFADAYPFLLIGQASLDELNGRLAEPVPMNRFRPNFVLAGSAAFEEDGWGDFDLGGQPFRAVKPCARCLVPTTDQDTARRSAEPLKTLTAYRRDGHKVLFGQNVIWLEPGGEGLVRIGDRFNPKNSHVFNT